MTDALTALDELMPVPSQTLARGAPWPAAARMYIYEGVRYGSDIARVIGRHRDRVNHVRAEDKWTAFAEMVQAKQTAERHGLALPYLMRQPTMQAQHDTEQQERAARAADIRRQLDRLVAGLISERDISGVGYSRMISSVAALQSLLDSLLGIDSAKRVATAAAIARAKVIRRPAPHAALAARGLVARSAQLAPLLIEPDVPIIMP